jgi:hypothetical protein
MRREQSEYKDARANLEECCVVVDGQGTDQTDLDVPSAESD